MNRLQLFGVFSAAITGYFLVATLFLLRYRPGDNRWIVKYGDLLTEPQASDLSPMQIVRRPDYMFVRYRYSDGATTFSSNAVSWRDLVYVPLQSYSESLFIKLRRAYDAKLPIRVYVFCANPSISLLDIAQWGKSFMLTAGVSLVSGAFTWYVYGGFLQNAVIGAGLVMGALCAIGLSVGRPSSR